MQSLRHDYEVFSRQLHNLIENMLERKFNVCRSRSAIGSSLILDYHLLTVEVPSKRESSSFDL